MSKVTEWQFEKIKAQDQEEPILEVSAEFYDELTKKETKMDNERELQNYAKQIINSLNKEVQITFTDSDSQNNFIKYLMSTNYESLKPERIIYNGRTTICKWKDGTKTVVKATEDDNPTHEHGVSMAIMRRLFDSRQEFLRLVNSGYDVVEEGKNRAIAERERKEKAYLEKLKIKTRKEELSQLRNISAKNIDEE